MSRYQGGGYGQNYGDQQGRGWGSEDYDTEEDRGSQYGSGSSRSQRNFEEGNWNRGSQRNEGRSQYGQSNYGQSDYGRSNYGQSGRGMSGQGQHSGRGPKGYKRGDERIQEDINEQLTHHSEIDAGEIEVKVSNGEVTLTGTVDNREAKRMAEDVAEGVSGVTEVQNQIRVVKTVGAARGESGEEGSRADASRGSASSSMSSSTSDSSKSRNRTGTGVGA
jgi:osmotically-inducible protein OsmY